MKGEQLDRLLKHIESLVTGGAAVNVHVINIENIEQATFNGAYRAMARIQEPIDETEGEKEHRLRQDGWKWKDIAKQIFPDIEEGLLDSEIDRLKKQHRREYPKFYRSKK